MSIKYQAMGHVYLLTNWLDFGLDLQGAIMPPCFQPPGVAGAADPAGSA